MRYSFPKARFVDCNNADDQFSHVKSELEEAINAETFDQFQEEVMDLYHSLETLFRIWERCGVDVDGIRKAVIDKNTDRQYYDCE